MTEFQTFLLLLAKAVGVVLSICITLLTTYVVVAGIGSLGFVWPIVP